MFHKYVYSPGDPINFLDPSGESFIVNVTIAMAMRGTIAGVTLGTVRAVWAYARGATLGEALWSGFTTAALTGFAFVSPLFGWSLLAATPALIGLGIYSGDVSTDDVPELSSYIAAGFALNILFKTPAYNVFEVKTALRFKIPQAIGNLQNGVSVDPARNAKWTAATASGNKAVQGSLIHAEVADLMRAQGMSNVKIEVSYDASGNATTYGAQGSVRLDYEVVAGGETVKVLDLKPGDIIRPSWIRRVATRLNLSAEDIEAISYGEYLP